MPDTLELVDIEWSGLPAKGRKVWGRVVDNPRFAAYWARKYVGWERPAVEVHWNDEVFYLDDENDHGWEKVTNGGLPSMGHRNLAVSDVRPR